MLFISWTVLLVASNCTSFSVVLYAGVMNTIFLQVLSLERRERGCVIVVEDIRCIVYMDTNNN